MSTVQADAYETEPEPDDPGWVLHEAEVEGGDEGRSEGFWLYHYADRTIVDEDGTRYEPDGDGVLVPVDDLEPADEPTDEPVHDEPVHDEPAYDEHDTEPVPVVGRAEVPGQGPARAAVLAAVAVLALLALATLAVVVLRLEDVPPVTGTDVDTATPVSRLELPNAVPPDTELVRSQVQSDGSIRVDHWIASTRPIPRVVLRLPAVPTQGAGQVTARDVRVETTEGPSSGPSVVRGRSQTYLLGDTEGLHVSYVLTGAVARSDAESARALARVTSLDLTYPGGRIPRTVVVVGDRILATACTADPEAAARPCGQAEGGSWRVRLEPDERTDLVSAQLDLV